MLSQITRSQILPARRHAALAAPNVSRPVSVRLFRREAPIAVDEAVVEEFNQPTKRQREQIKKTLQELGFTEQASDILAYGKVTNSNADLLIGDIRASFGYSGAPPPAGPENVLQDLLDRIRLPFGVLVLAAGAIAIGANRELLVPLVQQANINIDTEGIADSISYAVDDLVVFLEKLPGLDEKTLTNIQDALDDFLYNALQR